MTQVYLPVFPYPVPPMVQGAGRVRRADCHVPKTALDDEICPAKSKNSRFHQGDRCHSLRKQCAGGESRREAYSGNDS